MLKRILEKRLRAAVRKYPVTAVVGPRQSGKTTLVRRAFPKLAYASLETPDTRTFALEDPRRFLARFPNGVIIDEAQRVPELFSYIQTIVDERKRTGLFILTGSQHFSFMEKISQSLAGRVSILKLMPFSMDELRRAKKLPRSLDRLMFSGGYPRIYDKRLDPTDWLQSYVETYLDRDVRQIKNVGDLSSFHRFIRMAAHRSGQLLNLSSLAGDCGITHNTAKAWISILEASFLIFLLQPHHKNFNKRLKRSPKLYFYDTGLLCYLLGITKSDDLSVHSMRGAVFENFILSELTKRRFNEGLRSDLYFWQDKLGREVDCVIQKGELLVPVEIKSGHTIGGDFFKNLNYWRKLSGTPAERSFLVYAGDQSQDRRDGRVLGWRDLRKLPV